ncbi:MAG TPA: hypothetical protein VGC90_03860 [Candidatus Limnocylindrales bacterium]
MHRISSFEVAVRSEDRLREADLSRRNALASRRPGWATRVVRAVGSRHRTVDKPH